LGFGLINLVLLYSEYLYSFSVEPLVWFTSLLANVINTNESHGRSPEANYLICVALV